MKSLSEIETTSKRATKAAGFSWGIAEEVGKSIRLLELFGIAGIKNLNRYYKNALFTVAPIFKGSGMKTKIAESLMFGKPIIGLKEAFIGYEKHEKKIGIKCRNENDFIKAINDLAKKKHDHYEHQLRKIYLENYSNYSMKNLYQKIFKKI